MGMVFRVLLLSAIVCVLAAVASPAHAQIYVGRDASGTVVLSDQPMDGAVARSYAVANSGMRTTRAVPYDVGSAYDDVIEEAAATHGVRPDLVRAVIHVESGFNPRARSHKGAMGLMQLMPRTAADLGVDNPWDPAQNIRGGVAYLGSLLREFGDEVLALAAYNAGPGAVNRYGQQVPPYRETQDYVRKITRRTEALPVSPRAAAAGRAVIYKVLEVVDGVPQWRLTDTRPTSGEYQVIR
jgi:soluble lytic murein transglycosylase-like protein